jgi:cytochrome c oxidase subunit 3
MVIHFPHPTSAQDEKELGTGGKPPVDHRPTGGGGGGGDDGWNDGVNPHALLDRVRVILALALSVDVLAVVIVMAASLGRFASVSADLHSVPEWRRLFPWIFCNAALLMASCLTIEQARRQIFCEIDVMEEWLGLGKPALRRALPWLGVTLGLGAIFLAVQFLTWKQIVPVDAVPSLGSLRTSVFFSLAAWVHGVHLGLGLAALVFCLCTLGGLGRVELRQIVIDAVAWFWHAMGLVWLLLLAMLFLGQ